MLYTNFYILNKIKMTTNTRTEFIQNLAYIISREINSWMWDYIKEYFDGVRFADYNNSLQINDRDELAVEVLRNFDNCINILSDNFDNEQLISLFNTVASYLDYWTRSEYPENTAYEIGYNQAILDFNLLK